MRHCVGDYAGHVGRGTDILSLRDPTDRPHATIQIRGGRSIQQIKGRANSIVAERYRRYLADFVRDMGLLVEEDPEYTGLPYRPFDRQAPQSWFVQRGLASLIQADIAGRGGRNKEVSAFYSDLERHFEQLPADAVRWAISLFSGPQGEAIWTAKGREFDVAGEHFATRVLRIPWVLHGIACRSGGPRGRGLRRRLEATIFEFFLRFCREDSRALIELRDGRELLGLDLRRLRHEHQQRVSRRLAKARREMRPRAFASRTPYTALAKWERDRQAFTRMLQAGSEAYL